MRRVTPFSKAEHSSRCSTLPSISRRRRSGTPSDRPFRREASSAYNSSGEFCSGDFSVSGVSTATRIRRMMFSISSRPISFFNALSTGRPAILSNSSEEYSPVHVLPDLPEIVTFTRPFTPLKRKGARKVFLENRARASSSSWEASPPDFRSTSMNDPPEASANLTSFSVKGTSFPDSM